MDDNEEIETHRKKENKIQNHSREKNVSNLGITQNIYSNNKKFNMQCFYTPSKLPLKYFQIAINVVILWNNNFKR